MSFVLHVYFNVIEKNIIVTSPQCNAFGHAIGQNRIMLEAALNLTHSSLLTTEHKLISICTNPLH